VKARQEAGGRGQGAGSRRKITIVLKVFQAKSPPQERKGEK
jgi:hypothetical protein